jgi:carbon storage regulator
MLVLRRRAGEALLIGDDIEIQFLELSSQTVKIGIKAPRQVPILRKELRVTETQNQAAAKTLDVSNLNVSNLDQSKFAKSDPRPGS